MSDVGPGAFIRALPVRSFVSPGDVPGSSIAVRSALSYAVDKGILERVRNGVYYKGEPSRYGRTKPAASDVAYEILGDVGVGPAGFTAARHLGLTTQVPREVEYSTVGRVPTALAGIRVVKRGNLDRVRLSATEIAILEVLRDPATFVETGWTGLVDSVRMRKVELEALAAVAAKERPVAVRANLKKLAVLLADVA